MKREPVRVSDHAIVRYLERVMGFDIEKVRGHIIAVCDGPASVKAVCVRSEGVRFEIGNNVVITVAPDRQAPNLTARSRTQSRIERGEINGHPD